jgi:DNA-binding transcriptional ArsR family regulator
MPKLPPLLPDTVPVEMPELAPHLTITKPAQLRAMGDPVRERILSIIQQQPRTAKQLAVQLGKSTGSIGHQLRVLERAGLAKIVARRTTRGIIANYYTRTARMFFFSNESPQGSQPHSVDIVNTALKDLREHEAEGVADAMAVASYPRVRMSRTRARAFYKRIHAIVREFEQEKPDPKGVTVGLLVAMFEAPAYLQER